MRTKVFALVALIALAIACWWSSAALFGFSRYFPFGMAIAGALFASVLAWSARRMNAIIWIIAGLLILAGLFFLPLYSIMFINDRLPPWLSTVLNYLSGLWPVIFPSIAVISAALLLCSGLNFFFIEWLNAGRAEGRRSQVQRKPSGLAAAACLALSALLLARTLYNLYWVMVWDNTDDSLGYIWLILPVLAVLFSGFMLAFALPRWIKLAGLIYVLLVPVLMVAVSARGQQVDFRRFTEERGGQVVQAIETYYARTGKYPQDLRQLTPWTVLSLPGPVIIFGEGWCYDGGDDYYRLGYVGREHWSSPILFGTIYKTKGEIPDLPPICDEEISAALRTRYPDVYK